jgi:hypothetical protein
MNDYHIELDKLGKIIIYLRKSREEMSDFKQTTEETLARHEEILQKWAKANLGYEIPEEHIFREVVSGETIEDRPEFKTVLNLINNGDVDGLLVVEPERTTRGDLIDCGTVIRSLEITKTLCITPMKIYNLNNEFDKRLFKDQLLKGNEYLEYSKKIMKRGKDLSAEQGKFLGSVAPYGYDRIKCAELGVGDKKGWTLKPNENADIIKMIFNMSEEGIGVDRIAKHLKNIDAPKPHNTTWKESAIKCILNNEVYYGMIVWGRTKIVTKLINGVPVKKSVKQDNYNLYQGLHKGIITKEQFDNVQKGLEARYKNPVPKGEIFKNPLAGFCKCGKCGKAMVQNSHNGNTHKVRKYEVDKEKLYNLLQNQRKKLKIPIAEINRQMGCDSFKGGFYYIFSPKFNEKKFYLGDLITNNWFKLKELLKIETDEFDKPITEFTQITKPISLLCNENCGMISSKLYLVEEKIIDSLKVLLNDYHVYLDGYEEEYVKVVKSNSKSLKTIEKELEKKQQQLKKAKEFVEQEIYTPQEFIERKKELTEEIKRLTQEKDKITNHKEEDKVIRIKKAIPSLQNILEKYYTLSMEERNDSLKYIIDKVVYNKNERHGNQSSDKDQKDSIKLDIYLNHRFKL